MTISKPNFINKACNTNHSITSSSRSVNPFPCEYDTMDQQSQQNHGKQRNPRLPTNAMQVPNAAAKPNQNPFPKITASGALH